MSVVTMQAKTRRPAAPPPPPEINQADVPRSLRLAVLALSSKTRELERIASGFATPPGQLDNARRLLNEAKGNIDSALAALDAGR